MKNLILIRGVSGSGKSTFADIITEMVFSADDFFYKFGKYQFDPRLLSVAHSECQHRVKEALLGIDDEEVVAVTNTFTTEKELQPYFDIAEEVGDVRVICVVVENRHGNKNIHDVPSTTIDKQETRLRNSIKLVP